MEAWHDYRRWAFESAALDLALRQAGRTLVRRRRARAAAGHLRRLRGASPIRRRPTGSAPGSTCYPSLRFKLDPTSDWTDELVADLAATGAIDSVDLKGQYEGTSVDQPAGPGALPASARRVPGRLGRGSERHGRDAADPRAARALASRGTRRSTRSRISRARPWPPRTINIKPSRFGAVKRLFDAYDYCAEHGIGPYGGGQWELGPGRGQIQYLASLFHPDTPNDVAPRGYNAPEPQPGLPESPLAPEFAPAGFRWAE